MEDNGHKIQFEPETCTEVRCLFQQGEGNASTQELAEMRHGKLTKGIEDMFFDLGTVPFRVSGSVRNGCGRKVGGVNRIMDGDGDLKVGIIIYRTAGDTSPHRGKTGKRRGDIWLLLVVYD